MDRAPGQVWVFAQLSLPAPTAPQVAQGQSNAQTGGRAGAAKLGRILSILQQHGAGHVSKCRDPDGHKQRA